MIRLKENPNIEFETRDKAFAWVKENKSKIISLKKSTIYKSCEKGGFRARPFIDISKFTDAVKGFNTKANHIYPVINTTKYYDSHGDVHFNGIWDRSLKHNKGSFYYVEGHSLKLADVISWPENVKAFTANIPWGAVGADYSGETQGLIFEIDKRDIDNQEAMKVINEQRKVENSVRMQYVDIRLGINSDSDDFKEEKEYYDKMIGSIVNRDAVEEDGMFWGVHEAKIVKEGSLVLSGSNDATAIIYEDTASSTSSKESPQGTPFNVLEAIQKTKFNI